MSGETAGGTFGSVGREKKERKRERKYTFTGFAFFFFFYSSYIDQTGAAHIRWTKNPVGIMTILENFVVVLNLNYMNQPMREKCFPCC